MLRALALALLLVATAVPAAAPAPVPGTKLLLLRLSLRMDRIDTEYMTMGPAERAQQLDGAEGLLRQLRGRYLEPHQQSALFKIEMRVRSLRQDLQGHP